VKSYVMRCYSITGVKLHNIYIIWKEDRMFIQNILFLFFYHFLGAYGVPVTSLRISFGGSQIVSLIFNLYAIVRRVLIKTRRTFISRQLISF